MYCPKNGSWRWSRIPQDLVEWDICQLVQGTADGFPEAYDSPHSTGADPPEFDDNIDSPHWEDAFIQYE